MEGSLVAYKVFTNGSVLNASEINENLMRQSVMVFSNAAARTAAITSPVEGMLTWLEDVNRYESYSGTAWVQLVTPGAWVAYTPSTTGLTLGNGSIGAFYSRVGRMVTVRIRFVLGSTSSMGAFPNFSLPFTANASYVSGTAIVGLSRHFDTSADFVAYGRTRIAGPDSTDAVIDTVSGSRITIGYVNSTTPFTWAVNDTHEMQLTYEAAA
jgi:hypothetical protein